MEACRREARRHVEAQACKHGGMGSSARRHFFATRSFVCRVAVILDQAPGASLALGSLGTLAQWLAPLRSSSQRRFAPLASQRCWASLVHSATASLTLHAKAIGGITCPCAAPIATSRRRPRSSGTPGAWRTPTRIQRIASVGPKQTSWQLSGIAAAPDEDDPGSLTPARRAWHRSQVSLGQLLVM